jgi:DUF4097 and DUF4098 domain-containing protein YvlB
MNSRRLPSAFQSALMVMLAVLASALLLAAQTPKQAKFSIVAGGVLNVVDNAGSVTLHGGNSGQVLLSSTTHSDKVEVDSGGTPDGKRVDIRTHVISPQKPSADEAKVDYDITVPAGVLVTVTTATAPITVENLNGDLSLSSDTGQVTVRNLSDGHVHVMTVAAPVSLTNVKGGHVEISDTNGPVQLTDVSGPDVAVNTTSGNITYQGDCSGGGVYKMTTHNGGIDVTLPQSASVDLTARSFSGSVENDFPLQQKSHTTFAPQAGRSFAGTSNSGSSSVELQSFSGRIRVKKQ